MTNQELIPLSGEESLEELRRRLALTQELAAILDQAQTAILVRSMEDRITFWNQGAVQLYGLSRSQALGQISHLLLRTSFPAPLEEILAQLNGEGYWQGELIHASGDGGVLVVESNWSLRRDHRGTPVSILEVNHDITKRKEAESALKESEERYRRLFEDDLTGDYLATPQGRIIACNPALLSIFGLADLPEAQATNMADLFPRPEDFTDFLDLTQKMKKLEHHEVMRRRRDGSLFHAVENVVGEFDDGGRLIGVKGYLFDNTARKAAEEGLLKKDREITLQLKKIEKLNAALTTLLERREVESRQKEEDILATVEQLALPYLRDLKATRLDDEQRMYLEIVEANLKGITSPFARKLATWKTKLTPGEIKVADLVLRGKTSKEMANLLRISTHAVAFHRGNLRAKLGLSGRRGNLASHLRHID